MWLVAKNSSLLSPDLTLIILPISLRNLRVLGSIGPRTSMHIGKNSIEGRAFPYFFIFSSAALAAAKPHSLLVRRCVVRVVFGISSSRMVKSVIVKIMMTKMEIVILRSGKQNERLKKSQSLAGGYCVDDEDVGDENDDVIFAGSTCSDVVHSNVHFTRNNARASFPTRNSFPKTPTTSSAKLKSNADIKNSKKTIKSAPPAPSSSSSKRHANQAAGLPHMSFNTSAHKHLEHFSKQLEASRKQQSLMSRSYVESRKSPARSSHSNGSAKRTSQASTKDNSALCKINNELEGTAYLIKKMLNDIPSTIDNDDEDEAGANSSLGLKNERMRIDEVFGIAYKLPVIGDVDGDCAAVVPRRLGAFVGGDGDNNEGSNKNIAAKKSQQGRQQDETSKEHHHKSENETSLENSFDQYDEYDDNEEASDVASSMPRDDSFDRLMNETSSRLNALIDATSKVINDSGFASSFNIKPSTTTSGVARMSSSIDPTCANTQAHTKLQTTLPTNGKLSFNESKNADSSEKAGESEFFVVSFDTPSTRKVKSACSSRGAALKLVEKFKNKDDDIEDGDANEGDTVVKKKLNKCKTADSNTLSDVSDSNSLTSSNATTITSSKLIGGRKFVPPIAKSLSNITSAVNSTCKPSTTKESTTFIRDISLIRDVVEGSGGIDLRKVKPAIVKVTSVKTNRNRNAKMSSPALNTSKRDEYRNYNDDEDKYSSDYDDDSCRSPRHPSRSRSVGHGDDKLTSDRTTNTNTFTKAKFTASKNLPFTAGSKSQGNKVGSSTSQQQAQSRNSGGANTKYAMKGMPSGPTSPVSDVPQRRFSSSSNRPPLKTSNSTASSKSNLYNQNTNNKAVRNNLSLSNKSLVRNDGGRFSMRVEKTTKTAPTPTPSSDKIAASNAWQRRKNYDPRLSAGMIRGGATSSRGGICGSGSGAVRSRSMSARRKDDDYERNICDDDEEGETVASKQSNLQNNRNVSNAPTRFSRSSNNGSSNSKSARVAMTKTQQMSRSKIAQMSHAVADNLNVLMRNEGLDTPQALKQLPSFTHESPSSAFSSHNITKRRTSSEDAPLSDFSSSYDTVLVDSIQQVSKKVKSLADVLIGKMKDDDDDVSEGDDSATATATTTATTSSSTPAGSNNNGSVSVRGQVGQLTLGPSSLLQNANPELAAILDNLKKTELHLQKVHKTLFHVTEDMTSSGPLPFSPQLAKKSGFIPIDKPPKFSDCEKSGVGNGAGSSHSGTFTRSRNSSNNNMPSKPTKSSPPPSSSMTSLHHPLSTTSSSLLHHVSSSSSTFKSPQTTGVYKKRSASASNRNKKSPQLSSRNNPLSGDEYY
ncbi:hypothetical protein HELRODRAFT_191233 [Helobdella robusta]|uniref:Uncharacterized protein n=1 Tax=Helobdella robusta TaxID=6412 RepID=T1FSR7_HELRO|nr:hypothetical protein HELRODRAFT_191233 [Helobdella robusta]ESO06898.1 hypothetical protein HELRODRAFT_191233 [Helobdella robusta]